MTHDKPQIDKETNATLNKRDRILRHQFTDRAGRNVFLVVNADGEVEGEVRINWKCASISLTLEED